MLSMQKTPIRYEKMIITILPFLCFCPHELDSRNIRSLTIYNATSFFIGPITVSPHNVKTMKKSSWEDPPKYISIGKPY